MPMNRVQFQKGLSTPEFLDRHGTDDQCEQALVATKWPSGFVCLACGAMESRTTSGWGEGDDAYVREQRGGGMVGRDSENKAQFVAAARTTQNGGPQ